MTERACSVNEQKDPLSPSDTLADIDAEFARMLDGEPEREPVPHAFHDKVEHHAVGDSAWARKRVRTVCTFCGREEYDAPAGEDCPERLKIRQLAEAC